MPNYERWWGSVNVGTRKAAEFLGVGPGTIRRLIHEGVLPKVEIPGRRSYLIDMADLQTLNETFKSGSVPGSKSKIESPQVEQNAALKKRSPKPKKTANFTPKRVSIEDFRRVH